jgi:hypothetical protein
MQAPQPMSSIGTHCVSTTFQEDLDAPIAVARILGCQFALSNESLSGELCRGKISGPFILDTAGTRHLHFDLRAVQSSMRLEEPDALVTAHAQKMLASCCSIAHRATSS